MCMGKTWQNIQTFLDNIELISLKLKQNSTRINWAILHCQQIEFMDKKIENISVYLYTLKQVWLSWSLKDIVKK